jgi:hypothetical protein
MQQFDDDSGIGFIARKRKQRPSGSPRVPIAGNDKEGDFSIAC